ncbi:endo-1,4-beta-xylanase [Nocardioides renjunii]|uniref:endo-1,4-beta-xylanase n=1 Tax=Nocardioides renjunii TaxID=3095075 RepID=UPI002AFEBDAE|nr:endo-1,4-beta-xylanase [Nocardioides sp. S-34]WQQ22414.1 endo-1,4-beta-xylanase [Nocardioides sp. S-34]
MRRRVRRTTALWVMAAALAVTAAVAPSTGATAAPVVSSEDFEDGSFDPWTVSGGPTVSVVDTGAGRVLQVAGRANDYDGIQSPGLLRPGGTYTLTMRARLAPGTTGSADIRFVVKPSYTWVGNTTVTGDAWSTVSGTFTVPRDADPAGLSVYLGSGALSGSSAPYAYQVDDLVIEGGTGDTWTPTPDPAFVPGGALAPTSEPLAAARGLGNTAALTFDDGPNPGETEDLLDVLEAQGVKATFCVIGQNVQAPGGAAILRRIVAEGHTLCNHSTSYADMGQWTQTQVEADLKANLAIIREAVGDPRLPVPYFRAPNGSWGQTGAVAAALGMQPLGLGNVIFDWDGNDQSVATLTARLREAVQRGAVVLAHDGGGVRDNTVAAVRTVLAEKVAQRWTFTLPQGGQLSPVQQDIPGLKDVLGRRGIEHVGVAVDQRETTGRSAELLLRHFNAMTPENAGKPESVQPVEGQFSWQGLDQLLDFADANGVEVYGHVLVWHSQTPAWFFKDGTRDLTSSRADQALLRSRMRAHIKAIADHIDARYPDGDSPIWAMDVVNEVIADGDNANPHDMRDSRWFQVLGEGFVDEAFRLADRYFPDTKLFINDYNTEMPEKRADYLSLIKALQRRHVPIDGVGHQAHVDVARPVQWLEDSITAVRRLDPRLLQAITELDVNLSKQNTGADVSSGETPEYERAFADDDDAVIELGYYYRDLFAMLGRQSRSIDSVTFWGISNARTWLRTWPLPRPWENPLPFDDDLQAAPAYWGIVDPSRLPTRPADVLAPRIADTPTVRVTVRGRDRAVKVRYAEPSAIDTVDGPRRVTCSPASGSRFPVGTTTVTCTARDSSGNTRTSTFDVVVTRRGR